ncbi:MAG: hypothetical protein HY244_03190, partial [Rhizobiales bacterium]|nr:hypothetical protein [Hyphomicrobiales bacterium]
MSPDFDHNSKYEKTRFPIDESVENPSYNQFLDWASNTEAKALALDIWARGNYIRYMMSRAKDENPTVIVPFSFLDELRCYYRRMTLMDIPAHYVYVGDLPSPKKYSCLYPAEDDYKIDGGAGWNIVMSEPMVVRRRKWLFAMGCSRLMPEVFAEWLTSEASADFARGYAFLSPAELIGIPKSFVQEGLEMAADINNSVPFSPKVAAAELLLNLDLPYIDEMDHDTFTKIIQDNDYRLARFRLGIKKLITGSAPQAIIDTVEELKDEVAQMQLSDSGLRLRQTIVKFGGVFTTFGAGLSAFGTAIGRGLSTIDTIVPTIAGAATAGAVATFVDIW